MRIDILSFAPPGGAYAMPEKARTRRASDASLERLRRIARTSLLIAADETAIAFVIALALLIEGVQKPASIQAVRSIWFVCLALPIICAASNLYPGIRIGDVETIRRIVGAVTVAFTLASAVSIAFGRHRPDTFAAFIIAWPLACAVLPVFRLTLRSACANWSWWNESAVMVAKIGDPPAKTLIRSAHALGYKIIDTVELARLSKPAVDIDAGHAGDASLPSYMTAILYGWPNGDPALPHIHQRFRRVIVLQSMPGMPVEHLNIGSVGDLIGIEVSNPLLLPRNRILKRLLDIVLASAMLALSAPVILLSGIAIKVASSGPMLFRQRRGGLNGRPIAVRKIRTMYLDAEERLRDCLERDPALRREWNSRMKLSRDPRVVPVVGTLLRRLSLDELPQLVNVLRGDMSLVGPRPFPAYHLERFEPDFQRLRAAVRPGVTGMWQVMVRSEGGVEEQVQYDSHYIRNWSIWLDLYILARTAAVVLSGRGAY